MSNLQDGGRIIIGIENGTFERKGIASEHKKTFDIDIMKDQMTAYADPHVDFHVKFIVDDDKKEYAIIRVLSFSEVPIICKRDSDDLKAGAIYYRNSNRRAESAIVSNSYDMRNLIELAAIRMMRKKVSLGYTVSSSVESQLDKELDGL